MRSASLAPIDCLKSIVDRVVGDRAAVGQQRGRVAEPPTGANAPPCRAGLQRLRQRERAVDQVAGCVELGSATESVASPAVEITLAVVDAV